jgi:hypothetical protein
MSQHLKKTKRLKPASGSALPLFVACLCCVCDVGLIHAQISIDDPYSSIQSDLSTQQPNENLLPWKQPASSLGSTSAFPSLLPQSNTSLLPSPNNAESMPSPVGRIQEQTAHGSATDQTLVLPQGGPSSVGSVQPHVRLPYEPMRLTLSEEGLPSMSQGTRIVPYQPWDFTPNRHEPQPLEPHREIETYYGKSLVETQRPWVEWWRPFYTGGMYDPGIEVFSDVNLLTPSFLVYGDYRTGVGMHRVGGQDVQNWAHRLNLDMDLRFTGTERFHLFTGPLDHNGRFTRLDFSNGDVEFEEELDFQPDTAFFEGDLGAITGSMIGDDAPFDLPFTVGLVPLLFQNGIWMEDAIAGVAVALPWRHSRALNWANFDATFFAGFNQVTSPAFQNDNSAASVFGTAWFVEAYDGYIEMDYAYLNDEDGLGRSYHNAAVAYTRRYFGRISNTVRLIGNAGQSGPVADRTADGGLLILENSLVSSQPSHFVPYWNFFAGNGRPQSVARAANAGGILRNVGINFETDALTGYPTLAADGANAYGGAVGFNLLSADFYRQWIVEFAAADRYGNPGISSFDGPQYALGTRYQQAINNRSLWRVDFMNGWFDNAPNIYGTRAEFRWKF